MKNKLISAAAAFAAVIIAITACFVISDRMVDPQDVKSEQIIAANEIEQLILSGQTEQAIEKTQLLQENLRKSDTGYHSESRTILMCRLITSVPTISERLHGRLTVCAVRLQSPVPASVRLLKTTRRSLQRFPTTSKHLFLLSVPMPRAWRQTWTAHLKSVKNISP